MHIHYGIACENGPIIVTLFKYDKPQNQVSERGTITAENLTGPLQGMQVSDLIDEFNEGLLMQILIQRRIRIVKSEGR
jgi:hypothetical protein